MAAESKLQTKIISDLKSEGWIVNKIMLCGNPGWPDVECFRYGRVVFFEIKSKGKKAEPLQQYRHDILRKQGFEVFVIDSWQQYLSVKESRLLKI